MRLDDLIEVYRELLHLPDPTPLLAALAAVAANMLAAGDPVWVLLVGPPASGKSEIIDSLRGVPGAVSVSTMTPASLLSAHTRGGGGFLQTQFSTGRGLLLVKDLTSILNGDPAARDELLSMLREVFDGHIERAVATNKAPLAWAGKIGLISGVTEAIEQYRDTIALMGERFVYVSMSSIRHDRNRIARLAMSTGEDSGTVRTAILDAVRTYFAGLAIPLVLPQISDVDQSMLIAAANFGSAARSVVVRGGWPRDIQLVPEPELPGRLVKELKQLWRGLTIVGASADQARAVIRAATLGGIPKTRRNVLLALLAADGSLHTSQICVRTRMPEATTRETLEDLCALGVIDAADQQMQHTTWSATNEARQQWKQIEANKAIDANQPDLF